MVLKLENFGQQIKNTWKVLKYGAGEGWRRSVGPIMWEMKKCYLRVNEQRNIVHEIRKRKANWIGHILCRICLLKQVIEGKIKGELAVTRRRGRRLRKLLDDLKDRRGYSYLKEEALDRTTWRNRFWESFEPHVRQNTEWWFRKSAYRRTDGQTWRSKILCFLYGACSYINISSNICTL